jgi:hypothetical protein
MSKQTANRSVPASETFSAPRGDNGGLIDTADALRSQVSALAEIVAAQQANMSVLAAAAAAALAPKLRGSRTIAAASATVSEADRACAAGGFKRGQRGTMFRDLLAKGPGVYALSEVMPIAGGSVPARNGIPVAQAIARRLSRLPLVGYTLVCDPDETDAGKTELVFEARASDDKSDKSDKSDAAE